MIIETLTCGSLFLLAVLLITNPLKINIIANRWLSLFIFCIFSSFLDIVLSRSGVYLTYPHLNGVSEVFMLAMSPSLYLSVVYFTIPDHQFRSKSLLHFLPCLLFLLYQLPYFVTDSATKRMMQENPVPLMPSDIKRIILLTLAIKIQFLAYWLSAILRVRKHQRNIRYLESNLEPIHLKWIYYLLFFLIVMYLFWLNTVYFHLDFADKITPPSYFLASILIAVYALKQQEIFAYSKTVLKDITNILEAETNPIPKLRLSLEEINIKQKEIEEYMYSSEIFLDPSLSLPSLSAAICYPVHDLSYVLNQGFQQNFYQFINTYRIEKAKKLLASDSHQHLNMIGIAHASGFNSKTVFNTAFKNLAGMTPSQYKQSKV